jgi:hypothetical protein
MSTNLLAVLILATTASVVIAIFLVLWRARTSGRDSWIAVASGSVLAAWATVTALLARGGFAWSRLRSCVSLGRDARNASARSGHKPLTSCVRSSSNAVNHQLTNHFLSTTALRLSRASACGTSWRSTVRRRGRRCRRWRRSGCTLTACATVRPYTCSDRASTSSRSASGLATPV